MNNYIDRKVVIQNWPFGKEAAFSLNFDDFSPYYYYKYDFGGDLNGKLLKQQEYLLKNFDVKITHFVVPKINFSFTLNSKIHKIINYKTNKFSIINPRNSEWLKTVKELLEDNRIEIAMHGYRHFNDHLRKKHQEFFYDNYDNIKQKLNASLEIFNKAGIPISGFRPPGWGIDENEDLIRAIKDLGVFEYIAASSINAGLNKNLKKVDDYFPTLYKGINNIPQNIELDTNLEKLFIEIDEIVKNKKLISLKGHFTNVAWITNNFKVDNYNKLNQVLVYLKKYKIWYATFKEISDYFNAINNVIIEEITTEIGVLFTIKTNQKIKGLTLSVKSDELQTPEIKIISDNSKIILHKHSNYSVIFNSFDDTFTIEII